MCFVCLLGSDGATVVVPADQRKGKGDGSERRTARKWLKRGARNQGRGGGAPGGALSREQADQSVQHLF